MVGLPNNPNTSYTYAGAIIFHAELDIIVI